MPIKKIINSLLLLTSLLGYLEWGKDNKAFLFQAEAEVIGKLFADPVSAFHPLVLLPLAGQLALLVTIFQKQPSRILTIFGITIGIFAFTVITMFRRKKTPESCLGPSDKQRPLPRGRDAADAGPQAAKAADRAAADNPLARRFRPEREPATVDLSAPARFPAASAAPEDPQTATLQTDAAQLMRVVSCDPQTGKFYIHPGHPDGAGAPVLLQGEPVRAPTELRPGDTIRAGDFEFRFLSRA
jgi:hypothetical protein